jgi:hypothetical protein
LFHIAFPRFLTFFILGVFINPILWVIQEGKGQISIDLSTKLGNNNTVAPNNQIPEAGPARNKNENPPVFYGTAIKCRLTHIWNLQIDHPMDAILQHSNNINADFC